MLVCWGINQRNTGFNQLQFSLLRDVWYEHHVGPLETDYGRRIVERVRESIGLCFGLEFLQIVDVLLDFVVVSTLDSIRSAIVF